MKKAILGMIVLCLFIIMAGCNADPNTSETGQSLSSFSILSESSLQRESYSVNIPDWIPSEIPPTKEDRFTEDNPESNLDWTPVDTIEVAGEYAETFPVVTNETPLEVMLSEIDDPYFSMGWMTDMQYIYPDDYKRYEESGRPSLERIMKGERWERFPFRIPVNFLRKTGHGQYYTVCKQKDGGYVYIFFDRPREQSDYTVYSTTDETNVFLYGVLYAEKSLAYEDFQDVKAGDNINKVISIDNAALLSRTLFEWNVSLFGEEYYTNGADSSVHLLTDGILEVQYLIKDGELYVESMNYYEDYMYMTSGLYRVTGETAYKNLKVLPQDYPPA